MEGFLGSIDEGLLPYKREFEKLAVSSDTTLKFLRPYEVEEMKLPAVFKRMLIERIINLQTPDSKSKLKDSVREWESATRPKEPKRLKFTTSTDSDDTVSFACSVGSMGKENQSPQSNEHIEVGAKDMDFLSKERNRLNDERDTLSLLLLHKKDEMKELQKKPDVRGALGIPGNPLTKYTCDNCHHKGHRSMMNKGNKSCPYLPCEGYHACGLEGKHPEHRQVVSDVSTLKLFLNNQAKNTTSTF